MTIYYRLAEDEGMTWQRGEMVVGDSVPVYLEFCDSWTTGKYVPLQLHIAEQNNFDTPP